MQAALPGLSVMTCTCWVWHCSHYRHSYMQVACQSRLGSSSWMSNGTASRPTPQPQRTSAAPAATFSTTHNLLLTERRWYIGTWKSTLQNYCVDCFPQLVSNDYAKYILQSSCCEFCAKCHLHVCRSRTGEAAKPTTRSLSVIRRIEKCQPHRFPLGETIDPRGGASPLVFPQCSHEKWRFLVARWHSERLELIGEAMLLRVLTDSLASWWFPLCRISCGFYPRFLLMILCILLCLGNSPPPVTAWTPFTATAPFQMEWGAGLGMDPFKGDSARFPSALESAMNIITAKRNYEWVICTCMQCNALQCNVREIVKVNVNVNVHMWL